MRMRTPAIVGLLCLALGTACASSSGAPVAPREAGSGEQTNLPSQPDAAVGGKAIAGAPVVGAPARAAAPAAAPPGAPADAAQQTLPGLDRMIVRTVSMTLGVADVAEAYRQAERIALERGGIVAGSQVRQEGERMVATVTLRVPADADTYRATLEALRGIAEKVVDEQVQSQDVTEEHVDLESRIRNLRATEDSLLALLARAQRIEDILPIQRELTNVRGQIEQAQGRKQALERRSAMATINLQIREQVAVGRGGWSPGDTVGEALRALVQAFRGLATLAIWLVVWLPVWGVPLLVLWLLRRYWWPTRRPAAPVPAGAPASGGSTV
jgi:uncharacterized protein DUF4349